MTKHPKRYPDEGFSDVSELNDSGLRATAKRITKRVMLAYGNSISEAGEKRIEDAVYETMVKDGLTACEVERCAYCGVLSSEEHDGDCMR